MAGAVCWWRSLGRAVPLGPPWTPHLLLCCVWPVSPTDLALRPLEGPPAFGADPALGGLRRVELTSLRHTWPLTLC